MDFLHYGSVILSSFLASTVEFVEALTIVLAVGVTRGWRSALLGTLAAIFALAALIALAGPMIQAIPIRWMQLVIGALVAVFGLRWLKKATLRSAGRIRMHDEEKEFAEQVHALGHSITKDKAIDKIAFLTSFKAVLLEGVEVAFIVITAGSVSGKFLPSILGASAALVLVVILGLALHRPLSKVPENSLKKAVGILLSAFGVFWFGEGLGFEWPLQDVALIFLIAFFAAASFVGSWWLKTDPIS